MTTICFLVLLLVKSRFEFIETGNCICTLFNDVQHLVAHTLFTPANNTGHEEHFLCPSGQQFPMNSMLRTSPANKGTPERAFNFEVAALISSGSDVSYNCKLVCKISSTLLFYAESYVNGSFFRSAREIL